MAYYTHWTLASTIKKYWWALLIIGAVLAYKFFQSNKIVTSNGLTPTIAASCAALKAYQAANPQWIPGMC
jgi:hypothetical protein